FTATIAPAIFKTVLEYPILVAVLPFFRRGKSERFNFAIPILAALAILGTWLLFRLTHLDSSAVAVAAVYWALFFAGYKLKDNAQRFASAFAVLMLLSALILPGYIEGATRLYTARNFFGVKKVIEDPAVHLRKLLHGDITHGIESTEPAR